MRQGLQRMSCVSILAIVLDLAASLAAAADPPKVDLAAGYAFLHDVDYNYGLQDYLAGWFSSAGGRISGIYEVVGEVSGSYKTQKSSLSDGNEIRKEYGFWVGPRVSMPHGPVRPYGQPLIGLVQRSGTFLFEPFSSRNDFAVQPGGGADIILTRLVGLRVGGNLLLIQSGGEILRSDRGAEPRYWVKRIQFVAGVVVYPHR